MNACCRSSEHNAIGPANWKRPIAYKPNAWQKAKNYWLAFHKVVDQGVCRVCLSAIYLGQVSQGIPAMHRASSQALALLLALLLALSPVVRQLQGALEPIPALRIQRPICVGNHATVADLIPASGAHISRGVSGRRLNYHRELSLEPNEIALANSRLTDKEGFL
jgi:hypothetical protein